MDTPFFEFILILFITAPVFQGYIAYILGKAWRANKKNGALTERFVLSLFRLGTGSSLAILSMNRMFSWNIPNDVALTLLIFSMILTVIPSFFWLYMYYTDKF